MEITGNIAKVKSRINEVCKNSGRNPADTKIIAVSKTKPIEDIKEAYKNGFTDFGENYIQEALDKYELLDKNINWHFIGALQTNKVKLLTKFPCLFHSLDRESLASTLQSRLESEDKTLDCLIQVNTSGEETKSGITPDNSINFAEFISRNCNRIKIKGLMTIAENSDDRTKIRNNFRELKELRDKIKNLNLSNFDMRELSMGMSDDFEIAIEEGATMIRIGSLIFGNRNYN